MILVEGEKYACVQCIRGHRSSTCQHTKRPLVQVRARGRPNAGDDHRVTVFADQERAPEKATASCCSKKPDPVEQLFPLDVPLESSCQHSSKKPVTKSLAAEDQPVIMLQASKKQLYAVSKGSFSLLAPVPATAVVAKKHSSKCPCCTKRPKNPLRTPAMLASKMIKVEPDTRQKQYMVQPFANGHQNTSELHQDQYSNDLSYDLFYAKPCDHTTDCNCELTTGPNASNGSLLSSSQLDYNTVNRSLHQSLQQSQQQSLPQSLLLPQQMLPDLTFDLPITQPDPMDDCSCLPEECSCYNCPRHLIVDGVRLSDGVRVAFNGTTTPVPDPNSFLNRTTITNLLFNDFDSQELMELFEDCQCAADNCNCTNCFKHGIFNNEVVNFETPPLQFVSLQQEDSKRSFDQ